VKVPLDTTLEVGMTRYLFLIYGDETRQADATPEQWQAMMEAHLAWGEKVMASGATIVAGEALQPTVTATTVRTGEGSPLVTDGPFAETKEALGGFYLIDAEDLDAALALATAMPVETVEVRPILPTDG
jgi:hypothetical protein